MATFRRVDIDEFASTVNGGVDIVRMNVNLGGVRVDVKKKKRITSERGRLTYRTESGNTAYVLSGDVLYLKNGDTVEVV